MTRSSIARRTAIFLLLALGIAGCNNTTQIRVRNNLAVKVNVSFQPAAGNTVNVNDVANGTVSSYVDVPEGMLRVHVSSSSGASPSDVNYTIVKGNSYTAQVDSGPPPVTTVIQD